MMRPEFEEGQNKLGVPVDKDEVGVMEMVNGIREYPAQASES